MNRIAEIIKRENGKLTVEIHKQARSYMTIEYFRDPNYMKSDVR